MSSDKVLQDRQDEVRTEAIRNNLLSLKGAFFQALHRMNDLDEERAEERLAENLLAPGSAQARRQRRASIENEAKKENERHRFRAVVRKFFFKYDLDGDGTVDRSELRELVSDLGLPNSPSDVQARMREMDHDGGRVHRF